MSDDPFAMPRLKPSALQPLSGMTVLLVEDSRFACEAVRLLCLHSGARIRRADCLRSARRHLATYRPGVAIIDLGLPDGSGADLISELAHLAPRVPVVLGTSGDPDGEDLARRAGADGFLAKPLESLATFQQTVLAALPAEQRPKGPRAVPNEVIAPDRIAFRDDMALAEGLLSGADSDTRLAYVARFLAGVAISAGDGVLREAALRLASDNGTGRDTALDVRRISGLVRERLATAAGF